MIALAAPAMLRILGAASLLVVATGAWLALRAMQRDRALKRRIGTLGGGERRGPTEQATLLPLRLLARIGTAIARSGLFSSMTLSGLEHGLAAAGLRQRGALGVFIGSKLALTAGAPLAAWLVLRGLPVRHEAVLLGPLVAAAGGMLLPDMALQRLRQRYLARLEQGVPDALDMLVICTQAGLALEAALERVAGEMALAHPELARELATTTSELRIAVDPHGALLELGRRSGLDSLKRVTTTLVQTLQFGTPLSGTLRVLAVEMRQQMLTRFEERAARLPVMLTLPMIAFIFPCLFLVIGGPAVIKLGHAFAP